MFLKSAFQGALIALLGAVVGSSQAATLDFEDLNPAPASFIPSTFYTG